jgi:hypothetical protein
METKGGGHSELEGKALAEYVRSHPDDRQAKLALLQRAFGKPVTIKGSIRPGEPDAERKAERFIRGEFDQ